MKEENKRVENGKNYIDVIETTTYEEVTVKYPFGFEKKKLVKVQDTGDTEETDKKERKPLTKKQKAGIGLGVLLAAALGGRALAAHNKHDSEDEDYGDDYDYADQDDDSDQDDQDDSED